MQSNGWDNDTAALQLFSHLKGDALNVAHIVPLARRLLRSGLVDALTDHYGSPGRLADYRRQFERTTRTVGEDPAIFATALETLAVKAFGDMGQTARLRLIRDRFIAGHSNCDLRRHLDSVSPETPIRDIVDRHCVWESHADPADRGISKPSPDPTYPVYAIGDADGDIEATRVAAVIGQRSSQNQLEDLMTFLRLWNSPGGGPQLVPSGGSTVWTEKTLGRECPHDVVGLRPHKGTMWMSNDRVPLKNVESPYGGGVSSLPGATGGLLPVMFPAAPVLLSGGPQLGSWVLGCSHAGRRDPAGDSSGISS